MTPLETTVEVLGNTLRVRGELRLNEEKLFEEALRKLVDTDHASLVIDLSAVSSMSGSYVRDIALALAWAKQRDRGMRVRASRQVFHLLEFARVDELGRIELADERGGPPGFPNRRAKRGMRGSEHGGRPMSSGKRDDSPFGDSLRAEARARRERRLKAKRKKKEARRRMDE